MKFYCIEMMRRDYGVWGVEIEDFESKRSNERQTNAVNNLKYLQ